MGGSSGSSQPVPSAPTLLNSSQIFADASRYGAQSAQDQINTLAKAYPRFEKLQLGTIGKVAANLNDDYTQQAKGVIDQTLQKGTGALIDTGNRINSLGGQAQDLANSGVAFAQGPTALDNKIQASAGDALNVRPDQVAMPNQIRNVNALGAVASQISPIDQVNAQQITAAQMANVPNVQAQYARAVTTGSGALGNDLMASAQSRLANNGQLSAEELRNASQQASQSFAQRGLGTGSGAAAAEILNRAAASRQRLNEDSAFAQSVNAADLARRQQNAASVNQFGLANQATNMQAQLANQQTAYNTGLQNAQFGQQAALSNQDAALKAGLANQSTNFNVAKTNTDAANQIALANQSAGMQAQLANQNADASLNQQNLAAQSANQAANMTQLSNNRDYLLNSNNAYNNSQITRGNYGLGLLGNTANIYGQAGGAYQNASQLGLSGSNALANLDPYQRALGTGAQLGSGILGTTGNMIGNAYNSALDTTGNIASFNTNMQSTMYNSARGYNAAGSAARTSSNGAMLGAGIGAGGAILGAGIIAL